MCYIRLENEQGFLQISNRQKSAYVEDSLFTFISSPRNWSIFSVLITCDHLLNIVLIANYPRSDLVSFKKG